MPITTGLHLRQQQKLVMTPQLHQAIALLQLSTIELAQKIEEELVKNPVLEEVMPGENEDKVESEKEAEDSSSLETDVENLSNGTLDKDNFDKDEWLDKFEDSSDIGYQYTEKTSDNKQKFIEQTPEALPSLSEHLQFAYTGVSGDKLHWPFLYPLLMVMRAGHGCGITLEYLQAHELIW